MNKFTKLLLFLLVPGMTMLLLLSCEDYSEKLTGTNPSGSAVDVSNRITGQVPDVAGAGADLAILGSNLSGVTMVYIGGLWINDFTATDSEVAFAVPANIAIGENDLVLVFPGPERAHIMVEVIPLPNVSYFTPKAAKDGDEVTILGTNLSYVTSLSVGDVSATIKDQEDGQIVFTMPAGAPTAAINLTSQSGSLTSSDEMIISCSAEAGNSACLTVINTNGDFEESDPGVADGVNGWGGLNGSLAPGEITDEEYYEGFKSVKISVNELGANPWNIQPNSSMPVDHTATYHLSVWVKGTGIANAKFALDEGGTPGYSEWQAPEVSLTSNEWTEISYDFSPTSENPDSGGDQSVRFAVSMSYDGNVGGVLYMDNLRVTKVE
jgi:hypothetical protein